MFFQEPYLIYTISTLFLIALAILEGIAFVTTGLSMDSLVPDHSHDFNVGDISKEVEVDIFSASKETLDWSLSGVNLLNIGKVPFMIILASLAAWFAISGFSLHWFADKNSIQLTNYFSVPISFTIATIGTFFTTKLITKVVKPDESNAINLKELMGTVGVVVINEGNSQKPVQIKVKDRFNKEHYLMARVAIDNVTIKQGDEVILLNQEKDYFVKVLPKVNKDVANQYNDLMSNVTQKANS